MLGYAQRHGDVTIAPATRQRRHNGALARAQVRCGRPLENGLLSNLRGTIAHGAIGPLASLYMQTIPFSQVHRCERQQEQKGGKHAGHTAIETVIRRRTPNEACQYLIADHAGKHAKTTRLADAAHRTPNDQRKYKRSDPHAQSKGNRRHQGGKEACGEEHESRQHRTHRHTDQTTAAKAPIPWRRGTEAPKRKGGRSRRQLQVGENRVEPHRFSGSEIRAPADVRICLQAYEARCEYPGKNEKRSNMSVFSSPP